MGSFGEVFGRPAFRIWALVVVAGALAVATVMFVGMRTAFASHPEVSLAGSNFEIDTDANLKVDDAGSKDWANVTQGGSANGFEVRKADLPSGSGDDSFGNGSKEDTPVPAVVDGSIPPNKSDLLNFGVTLETNASGRFLNLFWHRVQEPSGTTNMDFEFNQSSVISSNGKTPVRTAGDLLIQYDLAQGGTNPQLFLSRWVTSGAASQCEAANSTPCWSDRVNLTAQGDATGSINTTAIPAADSDGLGNVSARTFGEAQLDFDALTGGTNQCVSFGSAYLKSRSSDSFTAAMKDFIAPTNLGLNQCATVIIRKQTDPEENPNTTSFGYTKNIATDPTTPNTFTLMDDGVKTYTNVLPGTSYSVDEDVVPAGWDLASINCAASTGVTPVVSLANGTVTFDIDANSDVLDCTYTNRQRISSISTAQSYFPNDTATVTGNDASDAPTGNVTFDLYGPDTTPNDPADNCTGTADYTQTAALNASGSASTTNGVPADGQADFAIADASEGTYWWKVHYAGDSDYPTVTSCVENSTVTINNGGTASSS